jgi:8-oxo-dGTP pyrophosphatase MutT (NUDIX family)
MVGSEGGIVNPRRAASVVVVRDGDEGVEVLLLRRTSTAAFAPDRFVFPGGSVDDSDRRVPLIGRSRVDESDRAVAPAEGVGQVAGVVDDVFVAGVRETCEEALILLALDSSGAPASVDHARAVRAALASGSSLAEAFDQLALRVDPASLVYHDRWITPEGAPRRFDTSFYYAATPVGQISEHDQGEAVDSAWVRPAEVLHSEEWTPRLLPPTRYHLTLCEQHAEAAAVLAAARADAVREPVRARLVSDGAGGSAVVVRPGAAPVPLGALPWREPGTNGR